MFRVRSLWPLHLEQAPQEVHSAYSQSTLGGPSHSALPHSLTSESAPSHGFPPCSGGRSSSLLRVCWPPPHVALQARHSSQWPSSQSTGRPVLHPSGTRSFGPGLHGQVSLRAPMHHLPLPRPYVATRLARCRRPLQLAVHSVHRSHSVSSQSTGASQATPTLQNLTSKLLPSGSLPHSLAILAILRCLVDVPPPQEAEQWPHCAHSLNSPSRQACTLHFCVLQGSTCSLSDTAQGLPPALGERRMWRSRVRWPPSQEQVQPPHSLQSSHSQSTTPQEGCPGHSRTSPSGKSQPAPPGLLRLAMKRRRVCMPTPQLVEQRPHSVQPLTRQSPLSQGFAAQPFVCISSCGQVLPPCSGNLWTCRWRCVCPPPQVLSQESQAVHSETTQSTLSSSPQDSVSSRSPRQREPLPLAYRAICRSRYLWPWAPQPVQELQSL
mmetsp:Transcript_51457/g.164772  ORF Transcript_51457/g.164772 Transcript_51457/m.164772 type:complete len:436 (+) Transcript_51457:367-1674(+)